MSLCRMTDSSVESSNVETACDRRLSKDRLAKPETIWGERAPHPVSNSAKFERLPVHYAGSAPHTQTQIETKRGETQRKGCTADALYEPRMRPDVRVRVVTKVACFA